MKKKRLLKILLVLILFIPLTIWVARATDTEQPQIKIPLEIEDQIKAAMKSGKVSLNFEDIDIPILAKIISEITGKNIILDDRVQGKLSIFSAKPVTLQQAWGIFISSLRAKGFEVVELKSFTKILPPERKKTIKLLKEDVFSPEEELVVYIAALKNADAMELQKSLSPLISSPNGTVSAYIPNNSLVIIDTAASIKKLTSIIKQVDTSQKYYRLRVYNPKFVSVTLLVNSLEKILKEKESDIKVSAYEPTNSLLAYVPLSKINSLEEILKNLDRQEISAERKLRVCYLQNADAEDIAKVISSMLKEKEKVEIKESVQQQGGAAGQQQAQDKQKGEVFSTTIAADKSTNSLILYVTDDEYQKLKDLISQLDIPRKQILISAVIAEVSLKKLVDVGIRWSVMKDKFGGAFEGGLTQDQLYGLLASGNFVIGAVGGNTTTITVNGQQMVFPNIFSLISLLQTDSDFNLLSAPRVVTLDNKEAKLIVGTVFPFATGIKFDVQNNPVITYDYKDIGLDLKITPHINQSDKIRLDIYQKLQEVTELMRPSAGNISYIVPISSQREFQTMITVEEGQTVVVGGLVSKVTIDSIKKFPILGDIPLIGHVFRKTYKENRKIVLFAFITPHIIDTAEKARAITEKYQETIQEGLVPTYKNIFEISPTEIKSEPIVIPNE